MGNFLSVNTNEKTQQEIGKASAEINVYVSYFICFFFILIGIIFIIFALTPTSNNACTTSKTPSNVDGSVRNDPAMPKDMVNDCNIKTRKYWFLLGGLFIPFGLFIIWFSKWWKHKVDTNVGYAHLAGLNAQESILRSFFHRR